MKSITYSSELEQNKPLYELARKASPLLEDVVGRSAAQVDAEWSIGKNEKAEEGILLRLSEWSGSVERVLPRFILENSELLEFQLLRLWGDLLQIRSDVLFEEMLETNAQD